MPTTPDRRLIEDFIPIREISAEASREKSIRKGHISTLHLWWARRPLVAARAAVYAALVPAPTSPEQRREYEQEMIALCRWNLDAAVLERARTRLLAANGGVPPTVLDMFAGGGAIPLEALRLGCETYATDLNPVAHLIQLCTLAYPQQYGERLAEAVEHWGAWVLERVRGEVGDLYPVVDTQTRRHADTETGSGTHDNSPALQRREPEAHDNSPALQRRGQVTEQHSMFSADHATRNIQHATLDPVAYLWTRTVVCPNPTCGATVPLLRQTWLVKKPGRFIALNMHAPAAAAPGQRRVRFSVVSADSEQALGFDPAAFSERGNALCPFCGATVDIAYVKEQGKAKQLHAQLMAFVCATEGRQGKTYISADHVDPALLVDDAMLEQRIAQLCAETGLTVPNEPLPPQGTLGFRVQAYGLHTWGDLFTKRQSLTLLTFCKYIRVAHAELGAVGEDAPFAQAVATLLTAGLGKVINRGSAAGMWNGQRETVESPVARGALPMTWDFPETNPVGGGSGNWREGLEYTVEALRAVAKTSTTPAHVLRMNAQQLDLPSSNFDAVITDPPYYDNIPYSHLSDFFYVWFKRAIGDLYPDHLSGELTPKKQEAIAEPARFNGDTKKAREQYEQMMRNAFVEARRVLKPGAPMVCVYAHKTTAGWSALADSLRGAGFEITEAWPLDTERQTGLRALRASFASSIFMVARRRERDDVGSYMHDVRPQLHSIVRERVATLRALGISGADLVIACVGAGLRAYTQFARVELPNGDELDARTFLDEVQRAVLEVILADVMGLEEASVGTVDKISQYYVLARYQYGTAAVDFDEANVLARGIGVELDGPRALTSGSNPLIKKTKSTADWRDYRARGNDERLGHPDDAPAPLIDVLQRLLWLNDFQPSQVARFLNEARPDIVRLKLVAEALGGRGLAAEPTPGAARDERSDEQKAIGRLLPAWRRVVEEQTQGRLL